MQRKICVIIPSRGESEKLTDCIDSVLTCDYASKELIVVNDGISRGAVSALERYTGNIRVVDNRKRGASSARNYAAGITDAEYLAFTDSDCIVDRMWLSALMAGFEKFPDAAGGGGRQDVPVCASKFEKQVFRFMRTTGLVSEYVRHAASQGIIEVEHNASCNAIYRRDIFLKEKGFLEGLWPGEDVEFDYRLRRKGYRLFFNPAGIVFHHKPDSMPQFRGMMFNYGYAQGVLVRRYGLFRKIHYLPPAIGICLVFLFINPSFAFGALAVFFLLAGVLTRDIVIAGLFWHSLIFWNAGFIRGIILGLRKE